MGKTQLFPGIESDFFRNRITHSLEVAQIAKSIAAKLNFEQPFFRPENHGPIDTDLVEVAGLAHDLGHPPFGHNGELALDKCMLDAGGFEGNAQTLRLVSRIEKKAFGDELGKGVDTEGNDCRYGLDLCFRTVASILKYDEQIPIARAEQIKGEVSKGYYASESALVKKVKAAVLGDVGTTVEFKTLECGIMDLADDIAYSTYDLEDAFKAGFLNPLEMLTDSERLKSVLVDVNKKRSTPIVEADVKGVILEVFDEVFDDPVFNDSIRSATASEGQFLSAMERRYRASCEIARNGYARTAITSGIVGDHIQGIQFVANDSSPALSKVVFSEETALKVSVLKSIAYNSLIMSPRLRVAELRGKKIVTEIFECLATREGFRLLPEDFQLWHSRLRTREEKLRVICDFIAGMTDRYAVEFHARLTSESPQSIFKPF